MRLASLQTVTGGAWQQARRSLRHFRDCPGNTGNPYSPALSIGLLLVIALAFNIGG